MIIFKSRTITDLDIVYFLRQLATLTTAGISILKSCELLQASQTKNALRILIYAIKNNLLAGKSLSMGLRQFPAYFDDMAIRLIQLSEHTGQMSIILSQVADHVEHKWLLKKKLAQLLFYPGFILCMAVFVIIFMLMFIVPRFAELLQTLPGELPFITRLIFAASSHLIHHVFMISISIILFVFLLLKFKKTIRLSSIPLFSHYRYQLALLQFTRHIALTFNAGLPITDSIQLAANTTGHQKFIQHTYGILIALNKGMALHQAMLQTGFFPTLLIQMVKMGEESGMLAPLLTKTADFIASDLQQLTHRLQTLVEPLIILVLGVLIGGLVIGMYLPIFKLGSAF